jgi:hypothetical protein
MKMNSKQLSVLIAAVVLFSLSELFPPWLYEDGWTSAQRSAGYHSHYSPPEIKSELEMRKLFLLPDSERPHYFSVQRDLARLHGQRIAIPFLAIGFLLVFSSRRSRLKVTFGIASLIVGCAFIALVCNMVWSVWY